MSPDSVNHSGASLSVNSPSDSQSLLEHPSPPTFLDNNFEPQYRTEEACVPSRTVASASADVTEADTKPSAAKNEAQNNEEDKDSSDKAKFDSYTSGLTPNPSVSFAERNECENVRNEERQHPSPRPLLSEHGESNQVDTVDLSSSSQEGTTCEDVRPDLSQRSGFEIPRGMLRYSGYLSMSQPIRKLHEPTNKSGPLDFSRTRSRTPQLEERSTSGEGQSAAEADFMAPMWYLMSQPQSTADFVAPIRATISAQEQMWHGLPRPAGDVPSMAPSRFSQSCLSPLSPYMLNPLAKPVPILPWDRPRKSPAPSSSHSTPHGLLLSPPDSSPGDGCAPGGDEDNSDDPEDDLSEDPPRKKSRTFLCHVCNRPATTEEEFKSHMRQHYDYSCTLCTYTSKTKGRLDSHMKKYHGPEGERAPPKPAHPKTHKCKECGLICSSKEDFWDHQRQTHIRPDKLLTCTECKFVTEYKHHLEYHTRNHMNSKPFKCMECNYICVNKSMLNSHMKSHSNVHQFRCFDCSYSTKYSHSLKMHCKNNNHTPAVPLNPDGSVPDGVAMEEAGLLTRKKRRAPWDPQEVAKRRKTSDGGDDFSGLAQGPLMYGSMGPSMVPFLRSFPYGPPVSPMAPLLTLPNRSLVTATVTSQSVGRGTMQENGGHQCPYFGVGAPSHEVLEKHIDQVHKGVFKPPPSDVDAVDWSKVVSGGHPSGQGDSLWKHPATLASIPPSFLPQQPAHSQSRHPRIPTNSELPWMQYCVDSADEPKYALKKMAEAFGESAGSSFAARHDGPLDLRKPKKSKAPLQEEVAPSAKFVGPWSHPLSPPLSPHCPPFIHGRPVGEIAFHMGGPSVAVASGSSVPVAPATSVPVKSASSVPVASVTSVPVALASSVLVASATSFPVMSATFVPVAPATSVPVVPVTFVPVAPATSVPVAPATFVPVAPATSVPVTLGAPEAGDNLLKSSHSRSESPTQDLSPPATTSTPPVGPSSGRDLSNRRKRRKANPSKLVVSQDVPSDHPSDRLLNGHKSDRLLNDHPSDRLLNGHPSDHLLNRHPSDRLLNGHKSDRLLNDHLSDCLLNDHPSDRLLNRHPSDRLLNGHKSDRLLNDHLSDCLLNDHLSDCLLNDHPSDRLLNRHQSDRLLKGHPSDRLLNNHPSDRLLNGHPSDRLLNNHLSDCLLNDHLSDCLLNDHPSDRLLNRHQSDRLLNDHPSDRLLNRHPSDRLLNNHPSDRLLNNHLSDRLLNDHLSDPSYHPSDLPSDLPSDRMSGLKLDNIVDRIRQQKKDLGEEEKKSLEPLLPPSAIKRERVEE